MCLQDLVSALQQRVGLLARESSRDEELLRQVGSELMCLQSSEGKLEGLVEELHAEAQHRVAEAVSFQAELHAEAQRRAERTESPQAELRRSAPFSCYLKNVQQISYTNTVDI